MPSFQGVNHQSAIRAFQKAGFEIARQSGHIVMRKAEIILVIPRQNPIKPATMGALIKAAGLTTTQFQKLLK